MNAHFDSNTPVNESVLSAQSEKADTAIEFLKAMKQDMTEDALEQEDVEAVIKMAKVYRAME